MELAGLMGKRLKILRVNFGDTQEEFAERIGATQKQISEWELGKILVSTQYLVKICEECRVGLEFFDPQKESLSFVASNIEGK